jgi:hypothetical protein
LRHHRHLASGVSGGLRAAVGALIVAASVCGGAEEAHAQPRPASDRGAARREGRIERPPATMTPRACTTVPVLDPGVISCSALEWVFASDDGGSEAARAYLNRRASAALTRAIQFDRRARAAAAGKPMVNSFEMPPQWLVRSDYELFNVIADFTGTNVIHRSYGYGTDVEEMRAFRSMSELEASRKRATYTDVEEYVGNRDDNKVSPLFLAGGLSLTALTGALAIVDHDEVPVVGESAHVRPMGWPPGLRLKGHFRLP